MIDIIKTLPSDAHFHLFENFPNEIYITDNDQPKFSQKINTRFLHACYVAIINGGTFGRASIYNNPDLMYRDKKTFCIGNYEAKNHPDAASKLLLHIFTEAKKDNAEYLIGPMNGSTWNSYRFSVQHNYPDFFSEPYHHLYYNDQFINAGFEIIAEYFSSIDNSIKYDNKIVLTRANDFKQIGVNFRNIDLSKYEEELEKLFWFNPVVFRKNFLYSPISKEDFFENYAWTKKIINPEFVILAEDKNKDLIGYFFCIDDLYNTREKSLIIKTIARHPDKKWRGLGHVIANMIYRRAAEGNYKSIIHAFMYDQGTSTNISKNFSGEIYKNYFLYGREI